MALSDAVKQAQQQAASRELRRLKEMRKYTKDHDEKWFAKRKQEQKVFECDPKNCCEEGYIKLLRMKAELKKAERLTELYGKILTEAGKAEREKPGSGEEYMAAKWENTERMEEWIEEHFRKSCRFQLEIGDEEKEGCEDGDKQGGHEGAFGENV